MEKLAKRQKATGSEIERAIDNYIKDGPSRRHLQYCKERIRQLDELWNTFEDTDNEIRTDHSKDLGHPYYANGYYEAVQNIYQAHRSKIQTHIASLTTSNQEGEKPEKKLPEEDTNAEQISIETPQPTTKQADPVNDMGEGDVQARDVNRNPKDEISKLIRIQESVIESLRRLLKGIEIGLHDCSKYFCEVKMKTVNHYWSRIETLHHDIWEITGEPLKAGYNIEEYFQLEEQVQDMLITLSGELDKYHPQPSRVMSSSSPTVKLPKITLPKFDGDYLKWRQFYDLFSQMVHEQPMGDCQKMWYLKMNLCGEAEKLVRHLSLSEDNYTAAWKMLQDRYNNTRLLVTSLLNKMLSQPTLTTESVSGIKSLHDTTQECLFGLDNLSVDTSSWDPLLLHLLIKKLDRTTHGLYEHTLSQPKRLQSTTEFLKFLENRFQSLEALGNKAKGLDEQHRRSGAAKALSSIAIPMSTCACCKGDHKLFACQKFLQLTPTNRLNLVKRASICINCLKTGHPVSRCISRGCLKCARKHNTLLHIENISLNRANSIQQVGSSIQQTSSMKQKHPEDHLDHSSASADHSSALSARSTQLQRGYVLLGTVVIKLVNNEGSSVECRALLDSGSQLNFITERLAKKLGLAQVPELMDIMGIGQGKQQAQKRINISIESRVNGFNTRLEAFVLPEITSYQPTRTLNTATWPIPSNIQLADPHFNRPGRIDFLIGGEVYFQLLSVGQIKLGDHLPTLQNSVLGWIVGGKINDISQPNATCGICSEDERFDQQVEKFWKLEEVQPSETRFTTAEKYCENHFNQTTTRNPDGRFIVKLPFKGDPSKLGESKDLALQRFSSLERKFAKHQDIKLQYIDFLSEYIRLGHMQETDIKTIDKPHYFLPHHCVVKPESSTTKLRVVFDASAKTSSNLSLNDILCTGPKIQDDLFSVLLRFRFPRYVFTADIEKMYRQILVHNSDQKYQLVLWRSDPAQKLKCYKLNTVTYGTTSAPYLAIKCLQRLAKEESEKYPLATEMLTSNFYVDDVMAGSNSLTTAVEAQTQLNSLLQTAGFKLRKWCANHSRLIQDLPKEDIELELDFNDGTEDHIKTLGLTWLPKTDSFSIKTSWNNTSKVTKRRAYSDIAHLFDPLGFMAPVVVVAKMFLQKLWALKIDWDAALPQELHTEWIRFCEDLKSLENIKFPRHVLYHTSSSSMQIHAFADASEKAYGAAIYIRSVSKDNIISVRLLCAKSRVAPLKQTTLPRLELCAAKLAAELTDRIKTDLGLRDKPTFLWTDSEIVLNWLSAPSASFHTFVANRVSAIQELTTIQQWGHVSSRENPADVLSRGTSPKRLETCNIWFYGPLFLHSAESTWPVSHTIDTNSIDQRLERKGIKLSLVASEEAVNFIDTIDHKNSFKKLQRIVAYMLRFITKMKIRYLQSSRYNPTVLTTFELQEALIIIVKQMQQYEFKEDSTQLLRYGEVSKNSSLNSLAPFIDERGIIRVGGRLQASTLSYDAKHPILLPYSHPFTKLIMTDLHMDNLHCGPQTLLAATRQRFWPMKGKTIARSVVQRCVRCARAKPRLMTQIMGNLPATRVQPARPFMNAGVDFCGPIWTHLKIRGKRPLKSYIAVFCCFATKATHLELVTDLSAYAFIGAIKRFIARRGHCKNLYCDNATNFIGAKNQLSELNTVIHSHNSKELIMNTCSAKGIDFHFIPPRAPHFGGLWEAAVKSAKHLLHRSMGSASLTYEELETVIIEIEAILNSRPLTQMSSNPNDLTALTPGHFLVGEPLTNPVNPEAQSMKVDMLTRWKLLAHIKNEFWQRWSREYLNELQQRQKWKRKSENVKPGTMVIIKEDNVPVMKWPLGRIIKIHKGEDGLVRVADVRTATNVFRRPIHKLSPLPITEEMQEKGNSANPEVERTNLRHTEVGQSTSTNAEEVRQEKDAPPKNKRKCSPISTITTLLLTCMILPMIRSSPVEIAPFNSQPGIYFENLGAANIIANEWHLVVYYDLRPYWAEYEMLRNGTAILKSMCKLLVDKGPCSRIISQFQHVFEELTDSNELLQSGASRNKRGALNIVGNVANALFGVLDSEYAEKMSQTIENINQNEGHLLQLLRNQTSIIDSTVNIIRKNQEMNNKHFQELEAHVLQTANRINNITEELYQEKIAQLFASLSIQLLLINTNFQRAQSSILDVITNTHQGRVSAELLSPQQLRHEIITIKTHLASSLRLPISQDNIANLYNLLTIEGRTVAHHVIFRLKLPLLAAEDFELFRIIPIPVLINETFVAIKPSSHFLVINLHRDQYYPLTEQELYSCVLTEEANHMCKQRHPIYGKGANISTCEIEFINHKPQSPSCQFMTIEGKQQWIQLYNPNQWIYAVKEKTIINIVCGTNVTQATLVGSGILTLQGHCTIKQEFITIQGHNTYPTNSRTSFTPSGNLIDFINPEKITPLSQKTHTLQSNLEELEALQRKITLQQLHELPYRIQPHDIHQYTIGYICLFCILVIVLYLIWRHRANLWENNKTKPTPLPRKNRRESFTVEVHLDE